MTPTLMSLNSTLTVLTFWLLLSVSITQSGGATARSLAELTKSAKECGPGGWLVPRSEFEEFARKRSSKRYCYRTGRIRRGTWVDAFLECQRNGSELVWVTSAEEAAWLVEMLHSYSVDRSKDDWFNPQNGWMVNAHRYLYSERNEEGARWKGGLFVRRPLNMNETVHDSEEVFKLIGTIQNTCENYATSTDSNGNGNGQNLKPNYSYQFPGDCFSVFTDRLNSVPCKKIFEEEFGYVCKKAYNDPAASVSNCYERCPAGWPLHTLNGQTFCYYVGAFTGTPITWYEALSQCRLLGMELWSPRRATETTFLNIVLSHEHFPQKYSQWWVNSHSHLYAASNASNATLPPSGIGLFWPDGQPMGTKAAGDGFSVTSTNLKPGDYCGSAYTMFIHNDNMVANVSSCTCQQPFGYLCRAPVCTSSELLAKTQYKQSLEERDSNPWVILLFILLILSVLFNVVLVLVVVIVVLVCKFFRRKRAYDEEREANNEEQEHNTESMPLQNQHPNEHPVFTNGPPANEYPNGPDSTGSTLDSRADSGGRTPAVRVLDPNSTQPDVGRSTVGTMDSNRDGPQQQKTPPPPVQVNAKVLHDTPSSPSSAPNSASGTLASRKNPTIAESDEEEEMH